MTPSIGTPSTRDHEAAIAADTARCGAEGRQAARDGKRWQDNPYWLHRSAHAWARGFAEEERNA